MMERVYLYKVSYIVDAGFDLINCVAYYLSSCKTINSTLVKQIEGAIGLRGTITEIYDLGIATFLRKDGDESTL